MIQSLFWNKLQTTRDTAKDKVIDEEIEIQFNVVSMPGILSSKSFLALTKKPLILNKVE
ncbi:MAG: hypothetical protein CM15mP33_04710 [Candidatus Neomarinimicrobiota bacterium]|nr:MAG: hypothetical protein CM15mP33_04710 [Candidatus Neomarinimicrobiota bacterium]